MSTPRGGGRGSARGAERGRGTRDRGRGNGAPAAATGKPSVRGGRGASRGAAPRGGTTTRGNSAFRSGSGGREATTNGHATPGQASYGGPNSTPFDAQDYSNRLDFIRESRPQLRELFIKERRMNPEGQMRLSDSVSLVGICTDMCPEFERVRRIVEDDVKPPECTPETEHLPRKQRIPDETRMVKAYARSAAGMDVELVSEIRSPRTCLDTINYLMQRLDYDDFDFLHGWIWDRTRAVRKDLRTQRIKSTSDIAIYLECLERSARFLLLSTHQMARSTKDDYSHQQDIEQLNATLMSLKERYVDNRRIGNPSEHEAEFYAYRLILAPIYTNTQLENELHALPLDLRNNPRVQTAIEIFRILKAIIFHKSQYFVQVQANWKRFWELVKSPKVSYLMACAAEVSFQRVRHVVLDTLWRVYRIGTTAKPKTVDSWTTNRLKGVLGLDTDGEAVNLCELFGFEFSVNNSGQTFLDICKKGYGRSPLGKPDELKPQTFSQRIVEQKRYNRSFSAVINGHSVRDAEAFGLTDTSVSTGIAQDMEDENSLFVPDTLVPSRNIFNQQKAPHSSAAKLSPAANPFIPNIAQGPSATANSNPFVKVQSPFISNAPQTPTTATTLNPFADTQPPFAQARPNLAVPRNINSNESFDPPSASKTPFANPFGPSQTAAPATTPANPLGTIPATPNFFFQAAKGTQQPLPAASAPSFQFTPISSTSQALSFTPAGTPPQPATKTSEEEQRKAAEEEQRRKAEAEAKAEADRRRAQEEEARRARDAVEQQRLEAEQQRLRLQQEQQQRAAQEARDRQAREEELRNTRIRNRESAWQSLTRDLMFDAHDGLMMQFVENEVINTVTNVIVELEEEEKQRLWQERRKIATNMYEQRQLAMKRLVMAGWVAKVEKKKRSRQARERRRRLKEQRLHSTNGADAHLDTQHARSITTNAGQTEQTVFRKPAAPASARRSRRTEQRRQSQITDKSKPDAQGQAASFTKQATEQASLTPVSMTSSLITNGSYSEAYQKSTAPIDRTETDWFALRAMGIDPSRHRKRSFDSASGEDGEQETAKRPRMSPPIATSPPVAQSHATKHVASTTEEQLARFRALQQSFRKSAASPPHPGQTAAALATRSSFSGRSSLLVEKARQLLDSTSKKDRVPDNRHDWGRSVPDLVHSASASHRRARSMHTVDTPRDNRAAYWARKSRFVPKHLYGRGPEAVHAYRATYGLNSTTSTRVTSAEPVALSSPIPTQLSYEQSHPIALEEYSGEEDEEEDTSSVEVIDVDAEEEGYDYESGQDVESEEDDEDEGLEREEDSAEDGEEDEVNHQYQKGFNHATISGNFEREANIGYANGQVYEYGHERYSSYSQNTQYPQPNQGFEQAESDELLEYDNSTDDDEGHQAGDEEEEEAGEYVDEDEDEEELGRQQFAQQECRTQPLQQANRFPKQPPQAQPKTQTPPKQSGANEDDAIELSD